MSVEAHLVDAGSSLREALARLGAAPSGLGVVLGDDGRLAGVVLDAALRREALAGTDLDGATVGQRMSREPFVLDASMDDATREALLHEHRLRAAPVIDDGRVVDVASLAGPLTDAPPVAVVMVGGRGERLRPLTDKLPKPLLRVGGTSIVERILRRLAQAGIQDAYLTVNYMADAFEQTLGDGERIGLRLHYVRVEEPLGTAGALALLPERPTGPVIVANGDIVTGVDFERVLDYHWHHRGVVTVCGVEHRSRIPYGVLRFAGHHLLDIDEKPERVDFVSAGMYVVDPELFDRVPRGRPSGMPDLIAAAVDDGLPVHVFPLLEGWYDIGSPEEFERVLLQFATGEES